MPAEDVLVTLAAPLPAGQPALLVEGEELPVVMVEADRRRVWVRRENRESPAELLERLRAIRARQEAAEAAYRAEMRSLALQRSEAVREARQALSLAQIGQALGISAPMVAKLQRRR